MRKWVLIAAAVLPLGYAASAKRAAKYIGSSDCAICHLDTHPAIMAAHAKTKHQAAMVDVARKPNALVAAFDADSPFKKSEVKYVLGTGEVYQNYLDKSMKLLPGKWLVHDKKWVDQEPMDAVTQCVGCHVTNFDPATKSWTELGVGCEACHGPGAKHSESMAAADIVGLKKLDGKKLNMVCGQCHSQAKDVSGKYTYSPSFVPGEDLGKFLTLKGGSDAAPNSQYNSFLTSKHESTGMICTACHETHGNNSKAAHQLRSPVSDLCLGCHAMTLGATKAIESLKAHAPAAAPDATCATCHVPGGSHAFKKPATGP